MPAASMLNVSGKQGDIMSFSYEGDSDIRENRDGVLVDQQYPHSAIAL
jgi:hypothetical protein